MIFHMLPRVGSSMPQPVEPRLPKRMAQAHSFHYGSDAYLSRISGIGAGCWCPCGVALVFAAWTCRLKCGPVKYLTKSSFTLLSWIISPLLSNFPSTFSYFPGITSFYCWLLMFVVLAIEKCPLLVVTDYIHIR